MCASVCVHMCVLMCLSSCVTVCFCSVLVSKTWKRCFWGEGRFKCCFWRSLGWGSDFALAHWPLRCVSGVHWAKVPGDDLVTCALTPGAPLLMD